MIELILEGRERVPLAAVQRQRQRLLCERTCPGLASSIEDMIKDASRPRTVQMRMVPPLYERAVVAKVADELREVIDLLRAAPRSAQGVARARRLITHATSPIHGHEVAVLREELRRIREQLESRTIAD